MKTRIKILFLILFLNYTVQAQISGQTFQGLSELPGAIISLPELDLSTESDFDGYFSLETPNNIKKTKLKFEFNGLTLIIKNFSGNGKINFEKIYLPDFKFIEKVYDDLSELEKKEYTPVYCWLQPLGYYTNELEQDYLIWNYGNVEEKIYGFEYDKSTKTITLNWKKIKRKK